MTATATIASTDIVVLLRDEVFVDFFNTFLNLPVFGQTPIYSSSTGQWDLWPELPSHLDSSPTALLAWLGKHRLPHFCKSSLCLHLVLCQKLLGFIRSEEAAKLLNWQSADRWLLEKCISGSQGMWRFRALIQGTAGEELTDFWLTAERLLGLDESDAAQKDLYLSLLQRLKAIHLREGSSVLTLCGNTTGSSRKAGHVRSIGSRREMLSKMQQRALFIIQSYWLPKFLIQCKVAMDGEKSCWPLLQKYRERLFRGDLQEPSGISDGLSNMHINRSKSSTGPYCSRKAKEKIWALRKGPAGSTKESHRGKAALGPICQQPEQAANAAFGGKEGAKSPRSKAVLHLEDLCEEKVLSSLRSSRPLAKLSSPKKPSKTLSFLPCALSADSCAGQPFRDFLVCQDRTVETRLVDLWHDLEYFLPVVLDPSRENGFFLRHAIADRICKAYLEENAIQQLPLETGTLQSLRDHLVSAEFTPWIFRTQKEICKVLCTFYEKFLAYDDETFLQFMSPQSDVPVSKVQGNAVGKQEYFLLHERINESLKLSQALHGTRNLEGLSPEHWRSFATQDLQKRGLIQAEVEPLVSTTDADSQKMTSKQSAIQKYSLAVSSSTAEPKHKKKRTAPGGKIKSSATKVATVTVEKPAKRPRHFVKVLYSPAHLQYFRQFLEERNAGNPLDFWMAVEKLAAETNPKKKSLLTKDIVRNYFCGKIPAEEQLDCNSSIIKEISEAETVTPFMLMTAQIFVQKALEERWFKEYQDLFPPSDTCQSNLHSQHGMRNFRTGKERGAWFTIQNIVKSICKFHREMDNDKSRVEFEDFLRRELENKEENLPITSIQSNSTLNTPRSHTAPTRSHQDKEMVLVKRQMFNHQLIIVNFLVDDLRFYLEINKFSRLADSAEARSVRAEKEAAFLRRKAAIINKVFLSSDVPPRLRVNIPEDERDLIWSLSSTGLVSRLLYHRAKVAILPILIHFWKRFCNWRVMKTFQVSTTDSEPTSLTSIKTCSEPCDIYSPSNHAVILFTLLKGIQVLLPQPHEKELPEEQKDLNKNVEKQLPSSTSVSWPAEQGQGDGQMSQCPQ